MSILQLFPAVGPETKDELVKFNKRRAVDDMAENQEVLNQLPAPHQHTKAGALAWFKSLIPAAERQAAAGHTEEDWKVYFIDHYVTAWAHGHSLALKISQEVSKDRGSIKPAVYANFQAITLQEGATWWRKREFEKHVYKHWNGIKRIAWRGDGRPPAVIMGEGQMPGSGFAPRVSSTMPLWRSAEGKWDVDTDTTVCVARDIRGSAFFPLNNNRHTYVYCVLVKEGWNTYYLQKKVAERDHVIDKESHAYKDRVWMFHEECVQTIKSYEVIAGFEVEREFRDPHSHLAPLAGLKFRLVHGRVYQYAWHGLDREQKSSIIEQLHWQQHQDWIPSPPGARTWLTYNGVENLGPQILRAPVVEQPAEAPAA